MSTKYNIEEKKILDKIGQPVNFNYPSGEKNLKGILKDRCVLNPDGRIGIPYWDVVDLIKFSEEYETDWIRIGYYRKAKEKLQVREEEVR